MRGQNSGGDHLMKLLRHRALPLLVGLALVLLGTRLGQWQLQRASEKSALQQTIEARAASPAVDLAMTHAVPEWQSVRVRGHWLADGVVFIDNRVRQGLVGYHVVMPLLLGDGRVVLVNRGWVAAAADRSRLPNLAIDSGPIELAGIARVPQSEPFRLAADSADSPVLQHLDPQLLAARLGRSVLPWVILQTSFTADGLQRDWPRPDAGIDRHHGYALQWFGLAALVGGLTAYHMLRRKTRGNEL